VTSYLGLVFALAAVEAGNGKVITWNILKVKQLSFWLKFFVVSFILGIVLSVAFVFLVIPFFFALAVFFPVPLITIVKPELGIVDIFKYSWEVTTKHFANSFVFILVVIAVIIISAIPFGLGLLISPAIIYIASFAAYKKLEATPAAPKLVQEQAAK
jgi:uncharacterized membrane protein